MDRSLVCCAGDNHSTITETRGRVANAVCAGCHESVDKEYEKEGGQQRRAPEEYWKRTLAAPEFPRFLYRVQLSRDLVFRKQGHRAPLFRPRSGV
jgi:hypothetical protein